MSGEHYPVLWIGRTAVVSMPAEIDITNAGQVREDLLSVLNQGAALLIADLSKTTFCDSAGISALARGFRRAEASRSDMRLVVSTLAVQRVLALTGIDRLLDKYPSGAESLAAAPGSGTGYATGSGTGSGSGYGAGYGNAAAAADTDGGAA
ncbi:MAG: STAS domain-containing protein [Streptosporangiaceae bacterium]